MITCYEKDFAVLLLNSAVPSVMNIILASGRYNGPQLYCFTSVSLLLLSPFPSVAPNEKALIKGQHAYRKQ